MKSESKLNSLIGVCIFAITAGGLFFVLPSAAFALDWPNFHGGNSNAGVTTEGLDHPPQTIWTYQAGSAINYSNPVVVSNVLYIGDEGGTLYAINTGNGTLVWSVTTPGAVRTTIAVDGSEFYYGDASGKFYARYISDGSQKWVYSGTAPIAVSPMMTSSEVVFGDADGILYGLNRSNGSVAWAAAPGGGFGYHSMPMDSTGAYIHIASKTGRVSTYQASNGVLQCTFVASGDTFDRSSPVRVGTRIFIGSNGGKIYAINAADCSQLSSFSVGSAVVGTPVYDETNSKLYIGTVGGNVYRLNFDTGTNTFSQDWQASVGFAINSSPILALGGSAPRVYIGADDLYVFHADSGNQLSTSATARIDSSFAISNSLGFVGDVNGKIYGYQSNPAPDPVAGTRRFLPEVTIRSPRPQDVFSDTLTIEYEATDENDVNGPERFGLGSDAISLYYSQDGGGTWREIVKFLPPVGFYKWDTSALQEGQEYDIRVIARDRGGDENDAVAGPVRLDRTAPFFDVSVDPSFAKSNEEVAITVLSNESLVGSPRVTVRQKKRLAIEIAVEQTATMTWSGVYQVAENADGTAQIELAGTDRAGNTGSLIRRGGIFNVDTTPPPTPIITSPLDNEVTDSAMISIFGRVEPETKTIVRLNGERVAETFADASGNVVFANIALSKTFQNGFNFIQAFNEDRVGNLSEPAALTVKYNIAPVLSIDTFNGAPLLDTTTTFEGVIGIAGTALDENTDTLTISFEVSADKGVTWKEIARDLTRATYTWDSRTVTDGEYILRIRADDGFALSSLTSGPFVIANFIPLVSFDLARSIINTHSVVLGGLARTLFRPDTAGITNVEYTLNGGRTWEEATPRDGSFGDKNELFDVSLSGLLEGFFRILARATDTRGFEGSGGTDLIVDLGPPPSPTVTSPGERAVFGNREDGEDDVAGTQVRLKGTAEPNNDIEIRNNTLFFEGASDARGAFEIVITMREHGENVLEMTALDIAGNRSETTSFVLMHNNPPDIHFLRPRSGVGVGGGYEVVFEVQDRDLDPVTEVNLFYRPRGTSANVLVARAISGNSVFADTRAAAEGAYEFVLESSDGVSVHSVTLPFFVDHTPPKITVEALGELQFSEAFTLKMSGSATDDVSGVEYVEYSIDLENWFTAIIIRGFRTNSAAFRVTHPFELADGIYDISFRATDGARNISEITSPQQIFVDTIPPRIGSFTLSGGPFLFVPDGGWFQMREGADAKFVISLEQDAVGATLSGMGESLPLFKVQGLWEAEVSFAEAGEFKLRVSAEDPLGNTTGEVNVAAVKVVRPGKVVSSEGEAVSGATMTTFVFDSADQSWREWQAEAYDGANPQLSGTQGEYFLLLPGGKYQLTFSKDRFQHLRTSSFEFANPRYVMTDFIMEPRRGFRGWLEGLVEKLGFEGE